MALSGVVIHVHGIQHNVTTYRSGDFFRLLTPGIYHITAERIGYVNRRRFRCFYILFIYQIDINLKQKEIYLWVISLQHMLNLN